MLPGPSIFVSFSVALAPSGAKFSPAEKNASISRPRLPPDSETAAMRLPFGGSACTKHSVVSISSSRPRTRITPSRVEIASKVSIEPASAPVCAIAAARPPSDAPSLSAITGLPAAILQRLADRHHDRAGLAGDRDRPGFHRDDAVVDVGEQLFAGAEIAEAVRPGHRQPGLADRLLQFGGQPL